MRARTMAAAFLLQIVFPLLAVVVGAVHSIYDPQNTGIKTRSYQRDPLIAQAFEQQQHHQQQQQQQRFTAVNQYANTETTAERLSPINNSNQYNQPTPIYERERHAAAGTQQQLGWAAAESVMTEYYTGCPTQYTGLMVYAYDCRRYVNCWHGRGHIQTCGPGTVFNPETLECDRPDKVLCGAMGKKPQPTAQSASQQHQLQTGGTGNYRAGRLLDSGVERVDVHCPSGVTGVHPHPTDCTKFLNCANGNVHVQNCGPGTAYSISAMVCDFKHKVDCSDREGKVASTHAGGTYETNIARRPAYDTNQLEDITDEQLTEGIFCPAGVSGLFAYPFDYTKFLNCKNGQTGIQNCVRRTTFSISKRFCDTMDRLEAWDHVTYIIADISYEYSKTVNVCPLDMNGAHLYPYDWAMYVNCFDGLMTVERCSAGMVFSLSQRECLPAHEVGTNDRVTYTEWRSTFGASQYVNGAHGVSGNAVKGSTFGGNTASGSGNTVSRHTISGHAATGHAVSDHTASDYEFNHNGHAGSGSTVRGNSVSGYGIGSNSFSGSAISGNAIGAKDLRNSVGITCPPSGLGLSPYPFDCAKYLRCHNGQLHVEVCPVGMVFSLPKKSCDRKEHVADGERVAYGSELGQGFDLRNNYEYTQRTVYHEEPDQLSCPPGTSGLFLHPFDCSLYVRCSNGVANIEPCPPGQVFSISHKTCVARAEVIGYDRVDTFGQTDGGAFSYGNQGAGFLEVSNKPESNSEFNIAAGGWTFGNGGMLAGSSLAGCPPGLTGLFPHPFDCTKYLNCRNGKTIIQNCIAGNVFSIVKKFCELKEQVPATERVAFVHEYGHELMDETEDDFPQTSLNADVISCPPGVTGLHLHPFDCTKYLMCEGNRALVYTCPVDTVFSLARKICTTQRQVGSNDHVGFYGNTATTVSSHKYGTFKENPSTYTNNIGAGPECPAGVQGMQPHPYDCTKYLNCANGITHVQDCGPGTAWNAKLQVCDFLDKVDCTGRQPYAKTALTNTPPVVECPAGATGIKPHPTDCTKFLNCANGVTHVQDCGPGTAWNIAMEVCDFIEKVDCSSRSTSTTLNTQHSQVDTEYNYSQRGSKSYENTRPNQWAVPENGSGNRPQLGRPTQSTTTSHQHGYGSTTQTQQHGNRWTNMQLPRPVAPTSDNSRTHYYGNTHNTQAEDVGQQEINLNWNADRNSRPTGAGHHAFTPQLPISNSNTATSWSATAGNLDESSHVRTGEGHHTFTAGQGQQSTWSATGSASDQSTHVRNGAGQQGPPGWYGAGYSIDQQSPSTSVIFEEGSLQPNRNYPHTVRQYVTPLAPFAPIGVTVPSTTTTTTTPNTLTSTNIYYAQPVGSQEDTNELFTNIEGGDLSPVNRRPFPSTRPSAQLPSPSPVTQIYSSSIPLPNQNLMPPPKSNQPSLSPDFHHSTNAHPPATINIPVNHLMPPLRPANTQQIIPESTHFNVDNLPGSPSETSNLFNEPFTRIETNTYPTQYNNNPPSHVVDESNLYGGLKPPPPPSEFSQPQPTAEANPTSPSTGFVKGSHAQFPEAQTHIQQIYPSFRNASFRRDPHYSSPYSAVAHSSNSSWSSVGRKIPQSFNPTPQHSSYNHDLERSQNSSPLQQTTSTVDTPSTYNRQYYKPSIPHQSESDPDDLAMQQLPISDALRMLLRPYMHHNPDNDVDDTHIMNLAALSNSDTITNTPTTTTTTSSTTTTPRSQVNVPEDEDVEIIFAGEQHNLVATQPNQEATHTVHSEFHQADKFDTDTTQNSKATAETTDWHNREYHQKHPHLPNPSPLISNQHPNSPQHHRHNHARKHQHNREFHLRNPKLPNPFETTTIAQAVLDYPAPGAEYTTARTIIASRFGAEESATNECAFDCGNGQCVKSFEICDGVNNCGNRKDESQCDHLGYQVRLAGGESPNMGRIEVKILDKWGYVCDDKFGLRDADVVCKEVGFELGASEVRGNSYYAPATTNISYFMDEVDCGGNETSLRDCNFKGWGVNDCGHDEVVGVVCKVPLLKCPQGYWLCSTSKECIPSGFVCDNTADCADQSDESERVCNSPVEYRLEGGRSANEGRLEVLYRGEWGTVCDDDFGLTEAQVFCNSLGFYGTPKIQKNIFGPGSGPIWLDQVSCFGNESSIDKCNHWTWGENNCNHTEDVGVMCTVGPAPRISNSGIKGGKQNHKDDNADDINGEATTLEDIGLYYEQWQRSSKVMRDPHMNQKRCGHFKQDIIDEYEHPEERVVNGTKAHRGHHPWQATIRTKGRGGISSHWCGAVLISKKHLLTAAHCLVGYPKGAYFVRMGDHYANIAESSETDSYIENWYIHEKFREQTHMNNDIALIVLKHPVRFNDYIQPICLPEKGAAMQVNRMCTISGWGSIKSGVSTPSNILRAAQLPILSDDTCQQAHVYGNSMTEGMFCAGSMDESVDACDGDSGGPLVCSDQDGETLYGIISWGQQCGYANKPGVYVRVEKYIDWIYEKINFSMQHASN